MPARRYDRFGRPNPRGRYTKRRPPGGRYRTQLVRLPRPEPVRRLPIPTVDDRGLMRTARAPIRDPKEKSILGRYWNALKRFRDTGDDRLLRRLERECKTVVDANGRRHWLVFDRNVLRQSGERGRLVIEDYGS
jgi:hypothetical protein